MIRFYITCDIDNCKEKADLQNLHGRQVPTGWLLLYRDGARMQQISGEDEVHICPDHGRVFKARE